MGRKLLISVDVFQRNRLKVKSMRSWVKTSSTFKWKHHSFIIYRSAILIVWSMVDLIIIINFHSKWDCDFFISIPWYIQIFLTMYVKRIKCEPDLFLERSFSPFRILFQKWSQLLCYADFLHLVGQNIDIVKENFTNIEEKILSLVSK